MTEPGARGPDEGSEEQQGLEGEVQPSDERSDDAGGDQQPLQIVRELYDLERRRIAVQEGRNSVAMRSLENSDQSDRRQFEFHTQRLASEERESLRAHKLARLVLVYGGGLVLLVLIFIMLMAFFGNADQSEIAMTMIREGAKAIGGAGFIYLVAIAVRRLIRPVPPSD